MTETDAELIAQVRTRVEDMGFELADLRRGGRGSRVRLEVRIDLPGSQPGRGVTVEDCAGVSRSLERWLDGSGILGARYVLEVSSPGIERPLRWPEHWRRFVGREVRLKLGSRGRVRATIRDVNGDGTAVTLELENGERVTVPVEQAREARLAYDWD